MTFDLFRVAEQGQRVIGCEYAEKSGPLFAKNMKLTHSKTEAPQVNGKIFKYNEVNVKIYTCDIFKFTR